MIVQWKVYSVSVWLCTQLQTLALSVSLYSSNILHDEAILWAMSDSHTSSKFADHTLCFRSDHCIIWQLQWCKANTFFTTIQLLTVCTIDDVLIIVYKIMQSWWQSIYSYNTKSFGYLSKCHFKRLSNLSRGVMAAKKQCTVMVSEDFAWNNIAYGEWAACTGRDLHGIWD